MPPLFNRFYYLRLFADLDARWKRKVEKQKLKRFLKYSAEKSVNTSIINYEACLR